MTWRILILGAEEEEMEVRGAEGTCAWQGCANAFKGELPHDWIRLCAYWSAQPETEKMLVDVVMSPFCKRSTVLCGKHAAELEGMLKPPDSNWMAF